MFGIALHSGSADFSRGWSAAEDRAAPIRPAAVVGRPTVLLADAQTLFSECLLLLLEPRYHVVGTVADGLALAEAAARLAPDVIIVDISLEKFDGVRTVTEIRRVCPRVKIIYLTACMDVARATEAMAAGGVAYVLKTSPAPELVSAIRAALNGRVFIAQEARERIFQLVRHSSLKEADPPKLTPREREVLRLLAEGRRAKEAAHILGVSPRTVEFHKYRISDKLGANSTAELTMYAIRHGIVAA